MKLAQLKVRPAVTAGDIEGTDEHEALLRKATPNEALRTCVLCLRGSFDDLDAALVQARAQAEVLSTARRELVDKKATMTWVSSQSTAVTAADDFVKMVLGQGTVSFKSGQSTVNCWEAVLLAGMLDNKINVTDQLQRLYKSSAQSFDTDLRHTFSKGAQLKYQPNSLVWRPVAGDIVLFDGLAHVAMATGERKVGANPTDRPELEPGVEIVSFWPAPTITHTFGPGTVATVALTTIEAIQAWLTKYDTGPTSVTFGCPNWTNLG
jgi:hypothetical protein